jgi:hypothetical protein
VSEPFLEHAFTVNLDSQESKKGNHKWNLFRIRPGQEFFLEKFKSRRKFSIACYLNLSGVGYFAIRFDSIVSNKKLRSNFQSFKSSWLLPKNLYLLCRFICSCPEKAIIDYNFIENCKKIANLMDYNAKAVKIDIRWIWLFDYTYHFSKPTNIVFNSNQFESKTSKIN